MKKQPKKTPRIILAMRIFLILSLVMIYYTYSLTPTTDTNKLYQGPVPQGYDLEHFRETGETIRDLAIPRDPIIPTIIN